MKLGSVGVKWVIKAISQVLASLEHCFVCAIHRQNGSKEID